MAIHITLKPFLLMASGDGSLARISGIADERFGASTSTCLPLGDWTSRPFSLSQVM